MHILITNDDGPPGPSSPYLEAWIAELQARGHTCVVAIPDGQRSWIGKAHLLGGIVTPSYMDAATHAVHTSTSDLAGRPYYALVPGTPATCAQLGLFHREALFGSAADFDLVISGPNFGRNTTAAFALSSGTIGGALEAAVCGSRAVALSFAFIKGTERDPAIVGEACGLAARVVERLVADWDRAPGQDDVRHSDTGRARADLYSVNVPLVAGISAQPVRWTYMLSNKWAAGSLYTEDKAGIEAPLATAAPTEASGPEPGHGPGSEVPNGLTNGKAKAVNGDFKDLAAKGPSFVWRPDFAGVWASVEASRGANDGLCVREPATSVTALCANYEGLYGTRGFNGELKL